MKRRNSHQPFGEDGRSQKGGEGEAPRRREESPRRGRGEGASPVTSFPARTAPGPVRRRLRSPPEPGGAARADSIAEPWRRRVSPERSGDPAQGRAGQGTARGGKKGRVHEWVMELSLSAPLLLPVDRVTSASPRRNSSPSAAGSVKERELLCAGL